MAIQINTMAVLETSNQIEKINQSMDDDFSVMEAAIRNLRREWSGNASDAGTGKMNYLKHCFAERRHDVMNDIVLFMQHQVDESYEITEKAVSSAASAFK